MMEPHLKFKKITTVGWRPESEIIYLITLF